MRYGLVEAASVGSLLSQLGQQRRDRGSPTLVPQVQQHKRLDAAWRWFDGLSNLQTVAFLAGVILLLVLMAAFLLAASGSLALGRQTTGPLPSAAPARPGERSAPPSPGRLSQPPSAITEPALRAAVTLAPGVRVREHPSTSASVVTTLPVATKLEILDESGEPSWVRVRTAEGLVGWVIASAID